MREEIDALRAASQGRLRVTYLDTDAEGFGCHVLAQEALRPVLDAQARPPPSTATATATATATGGRMVYVCGSDGFVEHWCGGIVRDENRKKVQGPLRGVLSQLDLGAHEVYKF